MLRLKSAGLLEYRDAAAPGQSPRYRFTFESVRQLRTVYTRDIPAYREETRAGVVSRLLILDGGT